MSNINLNIKWKGLAICTFLVILALIFLVTNKTTAERWSNPEMLSIDDNEDSRVQRAVTEESNIYVVWQSRNNLGDSSDIYFCKSENEGDSWNDPIIISEQGTVSTSPNIAVENGVLHTVWYVITQNDEIGIKYCKSTDSGESWSNIQHLTWLVRNSATFGHQLTAGLTIEGNNIYVAFCDNRDGYANLWLKRSFDGGENWDYDRLIWQSEDRITMILEIPLSLAVSDGTLHLVFSDDADLYLYAYFIPYIAYLQSNDNGDTWENPHIYGGFLGYLDIIANKEYVHFIYESGGYLEYYRSRDRGNNFQRTELVYDARGTSITIENDKVWIFYINQTNDDIYNLRYRISNDTGQAWSKNISVYSTENEIYRTDCFSIKAEPGVVMDIEDSCYEVYFLKKLENTKPTISITSHDNNAEVTGIVIIKGKASDEDGDESIEKVEVSIENEEWEEVTETNFWTYDWDTTTLENGKYSLKFRAFDGIEFSGIEELVLNVQNVPENTKPTISITSHANNAEVSGIVTISGDAFDEDGDETIVKVDVSIDSGNWKIVAGTTLWTYDWDTTTLENGDYSLAFRAYDGTDFSDVKEIVLNVLLAPENIKPTILITIPADNSDVSGSVTISGIASDEDGKIEKVEISINTGEWLLVIGTEFWNYEWDTTKVKNGEYAIKIRAFDGEDYSLIEYLKLIVENEEESDKDNDDFISGFELVAFIISVFIVKIIIIFREKKCK